MRNHFLHIGKTGGTALKAALKPVATEHSFILHSHRTRLSDVPRGDGVFFILRDPIDRFVSGFLSRQRKGQPRYNSEWSEAEREAFALYPTPRSLAEDLGSEQAAQAMAGVAHVRSRLSDWFSGLQELAEREEDVRLVLFKETLAPDFEELKRRLGLPAELTLPKDDTGAHRTPAHLDRELSPLATRNLCAWYAEDIELVAVLRAQRNEAAKRFKTPDG